MPRASHVLKQQSHPAPFPAAMTLWRSKLRRLHRLGHWQRDRLACSEEVPVPVSTAQDREEVSASGRSGRPFEMLAKVEITEGAVAATNKQLRRKASQAGDSEALRPAKKARRTKKAQACKEPKWALDSAQSPDVDLLPETAAEETAADPLLATSEGDPAGTMMGNRTAATKPYAEPIVTEIASTSGQEVVSPSLALALTAVARNARKARAAPGLAGPAPPLQPPTAEQQASGRATSSSTPPPPRINAEDEIRRILSAEGPKDILGLGPEDGSRPPEEVVTQAWKRLVLLLHPDKLQRLGEEVSNSGAEALHLVHGAKDQLREAAQQASAEVPAQPVAAAESRLIEGLQSHRKFEIAWQLPQAQDPLRPIEKYEVWGPRYFSEAGDPFDWVLIATLPPLQSSFVLVEEAPTQQDVMWAADRVLRPTLPMAVHAVNGRGPSEALCFEVPWADVFPWLRGTPSALCPACLRLCPSRGQWSKCGGCGMQMGADSRMVVRCPECHGEVLWGQGLQMLACTCCMRKFGEAWAGRGAAPNSSRSAPRIQPTQGQGQKWCGGRARGGHW